MFSNPHPGRMSTTSEVDDRPRCSKGWATRCAHGRGKRCRCACGGANHGMVYDTTTRDFPRPRPVQLGLLPNDTPNPTVTE